MVVLRESNLQMHSNNNNTVRRNIYSSASWIRSWIQKLFIPAALVSSIIYWTTYSQITLLNGDFLWNYRTITYFSQSVTIYSSYLFEVVFDVDPWLYKFPYIDIFQIKIRTHRSVHIFWVRFINVISSRVETLMRAILIQHDCKFLYLPCKVYEIILRILKETV